MSTARRSKITSPQTRIALTRRHRPHPHPLPLPPLPDEEAARTLFVTQRRIALRTLVLLGVVLFGGSGLVAALPALNRLTVAGWPVSWLLPTFLIYPFLLLLAFTHVRAAERAEDGAGRS